MNRTMSDSRTTDAQIIDCWYKGVGDAYRSTRGILAMSSLHDNPKYRLLAYAFRIAFLTVMAGSGFVVADIIVRTMQDAILLSLVWLLIGAGLASVGVAIIISVSFSQLYQSLKRKGDCDRKDFLRLRSMRKAFRWAKQKNIISQDDQGNWQVIQ